MSDWYPDAEDSIKLCREWAQESVKCEQLKSCRFYLFGSAIYLEGEQFDALRSDLDIVCVIPDSLSPVERLELLSALKSRKARLELDMIPQLHREVCDEPGVSVVALTPLEITANVHKSGARSFFDKNFFLDLANDEIRLGLDGAGERAIVDSRRQAIEFCQKLRNEYLAVSANSTGGLSEYRGTDPMPKALMRCAAQIAPNLPEGAWYDTRHGLEHMFSLLNGRREDEPKLHALYKKISIRRGGKGHRTPLSAEDQLLLAELLFDQASQGATEEVVGWEVRIAKAGSASSQDDVQRVLDAIRRLVPDARLRSVREGSIILTLQSSLRAFELFEKLFHAEVLEAAIGLDVLEVRRIENGTQESPLDQGSRLQKIVKFLERWQPNNGLLGAWTESHFLDNLRSALIELFHSDRALSGGTFINPFYDTASRRSHLDMMLAWPSGDANGERIGIEVSLVRSNSNLLRAVAFMMEIQAPVILILIAPKGLSAPSREAIVQMRKVNPNVHVVIRES